MAPPEEQSPAAAMEVDSQADESAEDFYTWKKNAPLLYDTLVTADLEWPSLTVQWLPDKTMLTDKPWSYRLLLGSDTSASEQNYVKIGSASLPSRDDAASLRSKASEELQQQSGGIEQEIGGYSESKREWNYKTTMRINHDGAVHRARYMPQNPTVMATKSERTQTYVFYLPKHPSEPNNSDCKPDLILTGHEDGGFGLSWSTFQAGRLLSSGADGRVCVWDISTALKEEQHATWSTQSCFECGSPVEAAEFDLLNDNLFFSGSDDGRVLRWDLRQNAPVQAIGSHSGGLRSLGPNHYNEHLLASAGEDGVRGLARHCDEASCKVKIWDLRNVGSGALVDLQGHSGEVLSAAWSPFHEKVLASSSADKLVHLWDLDSLDQAPHAPLFTHAGHLEAVSEVAWNLHEPWNLATVSLDNTLQIWTPASKYTE